MKDLRAVHICLIALLPWLLMALGTQWMFSSLCHDPWIYLGHMLNFGGHMNAFADQYAASRLSAILPGAIIYRWLDPLLANLVLHFGVYYVATIALYFAGASLTNDRAAFIAALLFGTNFFVLTALGSDYVDAYIITYFLVSVALILRKSPRRSVAGAQLIAAGSFAFCMFNANISSAILLPFLTGLVILRTSLPNVLREATLRLCLFGIGFIALFLLLSTVGFLANGQIWIFQSQIAFLSSPTAKDSPFYASIVLWIKESYWLLLPSIVICFFPVISVVGRSTAGPRLESRRSFVGMWICLYLALLFGVLILFQLIAKNPMIQFWFYTSWLLLPLSFLAMAVLLRPLLLTISRREWGFLMLIGILACVGSASARVPTTEAFGAPIAFAAAGAVLLFVSILNMPQFLRVSAIIVALAGSNSIASNNFRMRYAFPQIHWPALDLFQEFEERKPDSFSAIVQCALLAKRIAPDADVRFWFDFKENLGPVFNAAACTHWWGVRILNRSLPDLEGAVDMAGAPLKSGSRLLLLTENLASLRPEIYSRLHAAGFEVEILEESRITAGSMHFDALALRLILPEGPAVPPPGS